MLTVSAFERTINIWLSYRIVWRCTCSVGLVLAVVAGIVFGVAFGLIMLIISFIHRLRSSCIYIAAQLHQIYVAFMSKTAHLYRWPTKFSWWPVPLRRLLPPLPHLPQSGVARMLEPALLVWAYKEPWDTDRYRHHKVSDADIRKFNKRA